jgi:16S rRNA (uracil1498-N3)-methyltransferase
VLRRRQGEAFDAGLVNGPRGKGTVVEIGPHALNLSFVWGNTPPPLDPIQLIVGLPRPQTARKILQEATTLGVGAMHFVVTEKGETNYAQSTLWSSGEWRRHVLAGAAQAFCTRLPEVTHGRTLTEILARLSASGSRLALDNYESPQSLSACAVSTPVALALGAERGWSTSERELLRRAEFSFAHLGQRVLRTESACLVGIALIKTRGGLL